MNVPPDTQIRMTVGVGRMAIGDELHVNGGAGDYVVVAIDGADVILRPKNGPVKEDAPLPVRAMSRAERRYMSRKHKRGNFVRRS